MRERMTGRLAADTSWTLVAQGISLVLQLAYFVILARSLGVREYGSFIAVSALVSIVAPFAAWGSGYIMIRDVARNPAAFSTSWGNALLVTLYGGLAGTAFCWLLKLVILPNGIPIGLVLLIALGDLIFFNIVTLAGQAFQANGNLKHMAAITVMARALRVLAAGALLLLSSTHPSALSWAWLYAASSAVGAGVGIMWVYIRCGAPRPNLRAFRKESREGFFFATSQSAFNIYNDIDKTMLSRLSSLEAAGIYAVAYRAVSVAFQPIFALLTATYPGYFRSGERGLRGSVTFAKRFLPWSIGYGMLAFFGLLLVAPLLPVIFGKQFSDSVEALRWLSIIPLLKGVHYFAADALAGAGYQGLRTAVQVAIAVVNIVLNLVLIPTYSWRGAAWASVITDLLLIASLWGLVGWLLRKEFSQETDEAAVEMSPS